MSTTQIPVLIPVSYLLASIIIPVIAWRKHQLAYYLAVLAALIAAGFSLVGLHRVMTVGPLHYYLSGWLPPLGIEFILDPLSSFLCVIISSVSLLVLIYSHRLVPIETPDKEMPFYSLAMLLLTGLSGMVMTGDFFNLYVFLEISALSGYALLAIGDKRAPFAAFRYLTLGTAGAAFYLLGLAFIFISTGTLNMADVAGQLAWNQGSVAVTAGLVLIVLGACLKMALFPMHAWLPDAYTWSSSTATALIAPIGTKVAAYILIRVFILTDFPPIVEILKWFAAAGIIAGSILAISQTNIKRMLAYSSVANIGYIVLGIALANQLAFTGALLHILNHALMKAVLFLVAGGIFHKMGTLNIFALRGLPQKMPLTTVAFVIGVFSMVGIPPTGGFFSKVYLIFGAIEAEGWFFVAVILFSTLLNFVYFFRVIESAFFKPYQAKSKTDDGDYENIRIDEMSIPMVTVSLLFCLAIILVGVFNGGIIGSIINLAIPVGF
jgi:multicomponent Na+:H+ antiporter subunit D